MSVCATCLEPGIRDGQHNCPDLGDIAVTRQLGYGLIVTDAPRRARMDLALLSEHGYGLTMASNDQINIADQVLYQVTGYDAESASLLLELVEDWRPKPTVALSEADLEDIKARWREAYGKPGTAHPVTELRDEQPRACARCNLPVTGPTVREWVGPASNGPGRVWHPDCHDAYMETEQYAEPEPEHPNAESDPPAVETALTDTVCRALGMTISGSLDDYATALHAACRELNNSEQSRAYLRKEREGLREQLRRAAEERAMLRRAMNSDDVRLVDEMAATVEEQRTRADNAEERLCLAREALVRDGYFGADEIGDDIAPRLVEWLAHHRDRAEEAKGQLRRTRRELEHWRTSIVPELRTERDRLRAGEEPGYDPLTVPTPGQWIARWNSLQPAERLQMAQAIIDAAETANRCRFEGHEQQLIMDNRAWAALARVRELRDTWLRMTLEPGQVRRLLDGITRALDGPRPEGTDADEPPPGFVPFTPKHIPRTGDPAHALVVEPYRNDQYQDRWVFRCWGTDTCDGWLSLDHTSQQSAERTRDRHVAEHHPEEQHTVADTPACTATIEGPHAGSSKPVPCALPAHGDDQQHESAPEGPTHRRLHWTDHHAGATPHGADRGEQR